MKTLFIWSNTTKGYIKSISKEIEVSLYVFDEDAMAKIDVNVFQNIYILVELAWDSNFYKGYEIAQTIVEQWQDDENPPNIEFFSPTNQLKLFSETKDVEKFFVKSFKHNPIPFKGDFISGKYSKSKWKYLKKYALTEFGILNRISHTVTSILNKDELEIINESEGIIIQLKELKSIIGARIFKLINNKNKEKNKTYLLELNKLILERINEINLKKNDDISHINSELRNKKRLLLLEDNKYYSEKIELKLEPYFEVVPFNNGNEALNELKNHRLDYSVLIADLELLEENEKLDQVVQGIEVIDFVREETPHIAWRILTGLPRKGIKELIDVELNNILHKNQLEFFGYNEGMEEFISKLNTQVARNVYLIKMKGPDGAFWDEKTIQGNEGGKFKRFYYDLLNSYPTVFDEMWTDIYDTLEKLIDNPNNIKIPSTLITPEDARGWLNKESRTLEEKVGQLKKILTHRLIFFSYYKPGELVFYKGNEEKCLSNFPFWKDGMQSHPRAYTPVLGFKTKGIKPTQFIFNDYGQLFDKEIQFLKKHENNFEEFFDENEDFCNILDLIHSNILEDQKSDNSNFNEKYEKLKTNVFDINYKYCERILKSISLEVKKLSPNNSWNNILDLFNEFKYGKAMKDEEQKEFTKLDSNLKLYINTFLEK